MISKRWRTGQLCMRLGDLEPGRERVCSVLNLVRTTNSLFLYGEELLAGDAEPQGSALAIPLLT